MKDKFKKTIKRADVFGKDFKLNYKGKEKFQTTPGGCFTIMIGILVIS